MTASGIENRRHSRLPIELPFTLTMGGKRYTGTTGNISLSGAYLTDIKPPIDTEQVSKKGELELETSSGPGLIKCQIVYVGFTNDEGFPVGVGVVFCDPDDETTSIIWNISITYLIDAD